LEEKRLDKKRLETEKEIEEGLSRMEENRHISRKSGVRFRKSEFILYEE